MINLHLISRGNKFYIFVPSSYSILKVDKFTYTIIEQLISGQSKSSICKKNNVDLTEIDKMVKYLNSLHQVAPPSIAGDKKFDKVIERITLHVSNDCNLRCEYCYASGGNYQQNKKLMTKETAEDFVDFCCREFNQVKNIVFFGGEPLLNSPIINYVCQLFDERYKKGEISFLPKFGAITNGTIISPTIINLIEKYFSFITVSIDGPQDINDLNRVDRKGNGSYERISHFINILRRIPLLHINYESTFTDMHVQMGYSHNDIQRFMDSTFHISGTVLNEFNMERQSKKDYNSVGYVGDIMNENYPEGFWGIVRSLVMKHPKTMCPLYQKTFSVSVNGELYPCHLNTGDEKCCLGNINSDNVYLTPNNFLKNHPGIMNGFKNNDLCSSCWSKNLCGGCSRMWFYDEEKSCYTLMPIKDFCERNQKHIEEILVAICELKQDSSKWNAFLSKLNNNISTCY